MKVDLRRRIPDVEEVNHDGLIVDLWKRLLRMRAKAVAERGDQECGEQ
jgi:hypothetical protein